MSDKFTADLHLGHKNIIRYCNRPFIDIKSHDQVILQRLNDRVKEDDTLYIIGDLCWGDPGFYLDRIVCKNIYFILGSHDKEVKKYRSKFVMMAEKIVLKNDQIIVMTHCPHLVWEKSHYGSWNLFGHLHSGSSNKPKNELFTQFFNIAKCLDVGVDGHDFYPWDLDEIKPIIDAKPGFLVHDHKEE